MNNAKIIAARQETLDRIMALTISERIALGTAIVQLGGLHCDPSWHDGAARALLGDPWAINGIKWMLEMGPIKGSIIPYDAAGVDALARSLWG